LKLYTDALKSTSSAQKSLTAAQKDSKNAQDSLTAANTNLTEAQNAFNAAVAGYGADSPQARKASKDLELAQRGLGRAGYRVEQSVFAVRDAEKNLADVRKDPESTPQAIREAEIALAEAKLSSADAVDEQTRATDDLTVSQDLLNQAVNGAIEGSALYKSLSDALSDAKSRQVSATDALADAKEREAQAQERLNEANAKSAEIAKLYPKIAAGVPNPMAVSADVPASVRGNPFTGTFPQNSGQTVINVNAGLVSSPDQVAQEIQDILNRRARNNGGNPFTGTFG
jgi:chromosome segregation ATPase